jgi:type II secretory pathway pseudopilin PulG
MMVVILIIAILASMTAVAVNSAKEKARQTDCMSNLRQLGTAIVTYRADNSGRNPGWLSNLYPTYIDDKGVYVCRSDPNRGRGSSRPSHIPSFSSGYNIVQLDDNANNGNRLDANTAIEACSYFYEFSSAPSPWPVRGRSASECTWQDFKEWELQEGNGGPGKPCSSSRMPIIRCYHHAQKGSMPEYPKMKVGDWDVPNSDGNPEPTGITLNVAYAGNVVITPLWWQGKVGLEDPR